MKEYYKEYYQKNKDKIKEKSAKWREKNPKKTTIKVIYNRVCEECGCEFNT